jgi:hypothetical protein
MLGGLLFIAVKSQQEPVYKPSRRPVGVLMIADHPVIIWLNAHRQLNIKCKRRSKKI